MNSVNDYYKHIINDEMKKINNIKHAFGVVTEIIIPKNTSVVKVDTMGRTLRLLNKTNETLNVGDSVIIHYWDNIANGYIALRCGLANLKQGLHIDDSALLSENIVELYTNKSTIFNIDDKNKIVEKYGILSNIIMVNENPAIYVPYDCIKEEDFKKVMFRVDKKLFTNTINVYCRYLHANTTTSRKYIFGDRTICAGIGRIKYVDTNTKAHFINYYMEEDADWIVEYSDNNYRHRVDSESTYFTDLSSLENIGIIIAYQKINNPTDDFPYGYIEGYPVIRCGINNEGIIEYNGKRTDLCWGVGKNNDKTYQRSMYFGFANKDEFQYALAVTQLEKLKVLR